MHPALTIPEILGTIISASETKGPQFSCTLVSKAWNEVANSILWGNNTVQFIDLLRPLLDFAGAVECLMPGSGIRALADDGTLLDQEIWPVSPSVSYSTVISDMSLV